MPKKTVTHATSAEKNPPDGADHGTPEAPEPTGGPPPFPEAAWRGPFADYRAAMAGATEAPDTFHFAALWAVAGVCLRRRAFIAYGRPLYPNVYLVTAGVTGDTKKTTAMWLAGALLPEQGVKVLRGIGSAEALADWIAKLEGETPLIILEEFATLLVRAGWEKSTLLPFLTETFDCPTKYEALFRKNPINVIEPTPTLYAGTTPEWFWKAMHEVDFHGGFGNRLFFLAGAPKTLISMPGQANEARLDVVREAINGLAHLLMHPLSGGEMVLDSAARHAWDDLYRDLKQRLSAVEPLVAAMTKRLDAYALKLGMIYAAFERTKTITFDQITAATAVARYGLACAEWLAGQRRNFSLRGHCEGAILRALEHADLPPWQVHRRIGGRFTADDVQRAIRALMVTGAIIQVGKTPRGEPIYGLRGRYRKV